MIYYHTITSIETKYNLAYLCCLWLLQLRKTSLKTIKVLLFSANLCLLAAKISNDPQINFFLIEGIDFKAMVLHILKSAMEYLPKISSGLLLDSFCDNLDVCFAVLNQSRPVGAHTPAPEQLF